MVRNEFIDKIVFPWKIVLMFQNTNFSWFFFLNDALDFSRKTFHESCFSNSKNSKIQKRFLARRPQPMVRPP